MPSLYLGTPTTREFSCEYVQSLFGTLVDGDMQWAPLLGQAIDVARNVICERFLESGMDYLLMHDSDATWAPGAVQRLMDRELPAVTGIIFMRRLPPSPPIGKFLYLDSNGHHVYSFAQTVNRILEMEKAGRFPEMGKKKINELVLDQTSEDIQEIDAAGAHFMLVRRDVIEKIGAPWYVTTGRNSGEDFDFCRRVQRAGFKLYADFSVFTGHVVGPGFTFGLREFLMTSDKEADIPWTL